jgi:hypothetical protein
MSAKDAAPTRCQYDASCVKGEDSKSICDKSASSAAERSMRRELITTTIAQTHDSSVRYDPFNRTQRPERICSSRHDSSAADSSGVMNNNSIATTGGTRLQKTFLHHTEGALLHAAISPHHNPSMATGLARTHCTSESH